MTNPVLTVLARIDRALALDEARRSAEIRAQRIAKAHTGPFAHVTHVDECGAPILAPGTTLPCENR